VQLMRHINNRDVAIEVLSIFYIKEKDTYDIKVMWYNIGPHPTFSLGITQRIRVMRDDWRDNWVPYNHNNGNGEPNEISIIDYSNIGNYRVRDA